MDYLSRAVLSTICYADCLERPLTAVEVWRELIFPDQTSPAHYRQKRSLAEVLAVLDKLVDEGKIFCRNGFYFPAGEEVRADTARAERWAVSGEKLSALRKTVSILRCCPFVRQIRLTGSLARKNAVDDSDWDLLVVAAPGRIWTARFVMMAVVTLLGRRRRPGKHRDRLCLNYWVTTDSMRLSRNDLFAAWEYAASICLFSGIRPEKFFAANDWIGSYKTNFENRFVKHPLFVADSEISFIVRRLAEKSLSAGLWEKLFRAYQYRRISRDPRTSRKGASIDFSDRELVFHLQPQAPSVWRDFSQKCQNRGVKIRLAAADAQNSIAERQEK